MSKFSLVRTEPEPAKAPRTQLDPRDAVPHREVELVSDEEKRNDEQAKHRADLPKDFFKRVPTMEPPLVPGAQVNLESLLGFLAALETILPPETNYPILSSAKISYEPEVQKLYLEAGSHGVWTVVALKVISGTTRGFAAVMPIRRAKNILLSIRDASSTVVVGVDEQGICLGPHTVPFGGPIDDFPEQPTIHDWLARAAMPAFYFREVCSRVLPARSAEFGEIALHGALIDFEFHEFDGAVQPLCTIVSTDGHRLHVLRLPRMQFDIKPTHLRALPPTSTVSAGFFAYMKEIIQHEWAALEFTADQVVAKGEDFVVVARAALEGKSSLHSLAAWRTVNVDYQGYWLTSSVKLLETLRAASRHGSVEECRLQVDRVREMLSISSSAAGSERSVMEVPARGFDGPSLVDVKFCIKYLCDAIESCGGGLVRLSFKHDLETQSVSPVVIRGEDEQFKAIIMPRK